MRAQLHSLSLLVALGILVTACGGKAPEPAATDSKAPAAGTTPVAIDTDAEKFRLVGKHLTFPIGRLFGRHLLVEKPEPSGTPHSAKSVGPSHIGADQSEGHSAQKPRCY